MTSKQASILIVANRTDVDRISKQIEEHSDFEVLLTAVNFEHLVKQVKTLAPDIVIIDNKLPGFDWVSAIYKIKKLKNAPCVVVLTKNISDNANLVSAFREGADAYLLTESIREDLIPALCAVSEDRIFLKRADANVIRNHMLYLELGSARNVVNINNGIANLTVREKEVFPLLAEGKSIKEVAKILCISPKTVETHKYHIMEKLNIDRMADLTKLAIIRDLIPIKWT
ncbi:MAG: response regulator transcription factor [Deltaproteobacteria bacterium]